MKQKNIANRILTLTLLLFSSICFSQCWFTSLAQDIENGSTEFKNFINTNDEAFTSYEILYAEASALKNNVDELTLVSSKIDEIKNAGGYIKWKNATGAGKALDFATMDLPKALQHVKFRDLTDLARRDIVGLHDAIEFYKLRITRAIGNRSFQFPIGKTLDEVDEIVIVAERSHPTIPGVKTIEYRVPSTDGKLTQKINGVDVNKGYTTGGTKGIKSTEDFVKTIYDPAIWTDAKLEKALKESLQDAFNKEGAFVNGKSYVGKTVEGHEIEFWYRDNKVQTFYFK